MATTYLTVVYKIEIDELDNIDPVDDAKEWDSILKDVESDPQKYIDDGNTEIGSLWVQA